MIEIPVYLTNCMKAYDLMCQQERRGINFDTVAAKKLVVTIDERMSVIVAEVEPQLPGRPLNKTEIKLWTPPKIQFKKDGSLSAAVVKWFDVTSFSIDSGSLVYYGCRGHIEVQLPFHNPIIDALPMQLKHQADLKEWLLSMGWKPTLWNYKKVNGKPVRVDGKLVQTSPKFHQRGAICPGLEKLSEQYGLIKPIITWLSLRNRRSVLLNESKGTGWLSHPRLKIDGRLPAASTGLTNTKRQRHTVVANVPSVGALLGEEFRSLFIPSGGMVMIGVDASGLEARVKGSYTYEFDDGEYARLLLDPEYDEHVVNAGLWNCTRKEAKAPGYALQYNCQPPKLAELLGVSKKLGEDYHKAYWDKNWALRMAIEKTEAEYARNHKKYIVTIDGSKIVCRAKHSVFNALCQSTGAKIVDMAGIIMDRKIKQEGVPTYRINYQHDEFGFEAREEYAEWTKAALIDSIVEAGVYYNLNVPMAAEGKIGDSWYDVH